MMRTAHHSDTAKTPLANDQPRRMPCSPSHNQPNNITVHCATSPACANQVLLEKGRTAVSDMGIAV
jgi:hypothetical protein